MKYFPPFATPADAKRPSKMPRLFHRPPKYRRHKTSAIVSLFGKRIHLGPYGSQKGHERYQELLEEWEEQRHASRQRRAESGPTDANAVVASVTEEHLRQKYKSGVPVVTNELILVISSSHARILPEAR